jgi:DNA primase
VTAIDEIKARLDIVDVVSETVKLRRAGKNFSGFCPFHPNTRTPAFVVFPDSGTWRCFGQCNEGGDIFRFVMKKEGWDFSQALQHLAQRAGVQLEPLTPEKKEEDDHNARLRTLLEEAVNFYRHQLLNTAAGKNALAYLHKRGLKDSALEAFGVGYAPEAWDAALNYFVSRNYSSEDLLQVGLVTERQQGGGVYDRFRNRILFPIRDAVGRMAGFGARILNPDDMPKFINSPQTALFDKGRLLYGLDAARKAIRASDQVVIVEGYLDVMALHQEGFANAVSPMGTALTEDQLRQIKRFTRRIVLALDADAAGEKATLRGLEVARQAMDHSSEMIFDARGLLRHEARLQADLRVTTLPPGLDPDDVVLRDPQEWAKIVSASQPVVVHVMNTLAATRNMDDAKAKSEIATQVLPLIEDVPNAVERESYRQLLARTLRVDERALVTFQPRRTPSGRREKSRQSAEQQETAAPPLSGKVQLTLDLERHCLALLLRDPETIYLMDRALQKAGLTRFSVEDFDHGDHQTLARAILHSLQQEDVDPRQYLEEQPPRDVEELCRTLQIPLARGEPTLEQLREDLFRTLLRLRSVRIEEGLQQLRFLQEELQEQGDTSLGPYHELFVQYNQTRAKIHQAMAHPVQFD